ncbi:MAG TPA: RNA polymerase sigma factor region1.1 domain-containing protein [Anaeromyxobacter sp.]
MRTGSESHEARKALFQLGIRRGTLTLDEIDRALPPGSLSPSERWLLFYSLRAAGVQIRDREGTSVDVPGEPPGGHSPGP